MGRRHAGLLHQARTIRLLAAAILFGLAFPARAEDPPSRGGSVVGLPPSSAIIGTPRRQPDGSIAILPENVRPAPNAPAPARVHSENRSARSTPTAAVSEVATPSAPGTAPTIKNALAGGDHSPPGATIVSQIHNAPGWQHSHTYTPAAGPYTRVVNGPGWSEAKDSDRGILQGIVSTFTSSPGGNDANGRYNPGQMLDAYQLISTGPCTSASSGGPSGTGSSIKDGTCTWKYLSRVDYISLTGWAYDNKPWQSGTAYNYLDVVVADTPLRAYALQDNRCTSTVAPTGTGTGTKVAFATSDGCHWQYHAEIIYTSKKSYIPTQTYTKSDGPATLKVTANHEAQLWNDREYVAGQHGELSPIRTQNHNDYRREGGVILGCTHLPCYHLIITTAPGESFRDTMTPSDPLTGYDPSKGVAIRNNLPYKWPNEPAGFLAYDNYVDLIGLQIKSVHGAAVDGMSAYGNKMTIRDSILEGGSNDQYTSRAAVTVDTSSVLANSLVIAHGPIGVFAKYPMFVLHSTIVNPSRAANSVGIATYFKWVYNDTTVSNTAIFGFTHAVAHGKAGTSWSPQSSHNITDAPSDDAGMAPWAYSNSNATSTTVDVLPGTTYGASMVRAFVAPGSDWRLASGSPLLGAGSAFGAFPINCIIKFPSCAQRTTYEFDSPDIIGTARPQAGRYDIGAWQSCPSPRCSSTRRVAPALP